jgi:hypothetical protein
MGSYLAVETKVIEVMESLLNGVGGGRYQFGTTNKSMGLGFGYTIRRVSIVFNLSTLLHSSRLSSCYFFYVSLSLFFSLFTDG